MQIAPSSGPYTPVDYTVLRKTTVRKGPESDSKAVGELRPGQVVRSLEERNVKDASNKGIHCRCRVGDGQWVSRVTGVGTVLFVPYSPAFQMYTAVAKVTVRAALSTESTAVRELKAGQALVVQCPLHRS